MNRINHLFERKPHNILSLYFTAGYPELDHTSQIIASLDKAEIDLIEIGIPFSDPMADGPTIQESNYRALQNNFSIDILFNQLKDIRSVTSIPLVLMGYFNPLYKYGVEKFCQRASACGIDGFIIPDLPLREYTLNYKQVFDKYQLCMNFLITPATTLERIAEIDEISTGFIYLVTSFGVTGGQLEFNEKQISCLEKIASLKLKTPVVAGFGIHDRNGFERVCNYVNGAIIGSAFIKLLQKTTGNQSANIQEFIKTIR